nr:N-acetylglucosamine-1-phosphodiester alpha-N-acetylglucosaminidase-like isoform X1 [Crassostrea gigas]
MNSEYMKLFLIPILFGSSYADDGICDNNTVIPACCTSYMYNDTLQQCVACIGRFGVNCSQSCPLGYYGRRCNETCNCNFTVCDEVTGCLKVTSDQTELYENITFRELDLCKPKDSGLILRHTLTALVFFLSLLIGITVTIACRLKRKTETRNPVVSTKDSLIYDRNTCASSSIYIDVIPPRTTPVRVVELIDQTDYSEIN